MDATIKEADSKPCIPCRATLILAIVVFIATAIFAGAISLGYL
jgi:hypothetical protein